MISTAFFTIFYLLLRAVYTVMPNASQPILPEGIEGGLELLGSGLGVLANFIDVSTWLTVLGLVLGIEMSILLFNFWNFVYNKIRGSGG